MRIRSMEEYLEWFERLQNRGDFAEEETQDPDKFREVLNQMLRINLAGKVDFYTALQISALQEARSFVRGKLVPAGVRGVLRKIRSKGVHVRTELRFAAKGLRGLFKLATLKSRGIVKQ